MFPDFKQQVLDDAQKSPAIAISFDESLNKIVQRGQMDLLIRYELEGKVYFRYFRSVFLVRQWVEDLLEAFFIR